MTILQFLAEWAIRSSALIVSGMALLAALRVKDSWVRSAVWTAALCGSVAMPLLSVAVGKSPAVALPRLSAPSSPEPAAPIAATAPPARLQTSAAAPGFDWARTAVALYGVVALGLLLRLAIGIWVGARLSRFSRLAGDFRDSDQLSGPVTIGIVHPRIVLPADWREWDRQKLDAVLAHERSHIRRGDPAWQMLSALHRALLWFSPMAWYLHKQVVRTAEDACDDAAVNQTRDQVKYAEVLLEFVQRGVGPAGWSVPMARYGRPEARIQRVLDGARFSAGLSPLRKGLIVTIAVPLAALVAQTRLEPAAPPVNVTASVAAQQPATPASPARAAGPARPAQPAKPRTEFGDLAMMGSVQAASTVRVTPLVEGQLLSVSFHEGQMVQAGDILATLDSRPYEPAVAEAQAQVDQDEAHLFTPVDPNPDVRLALAELKAKIRIDQAKLDAATLRLNETKIKAPIAGVTGLRRIDAGNMVHPGETLVVITQLAPVEVVFSVPQTQLPALHARVAGSAPLTVQARSAGDGPQGKVSVGQVTALDNQIDPQTGMGKVKAAFPNRDGALLPGEFVTVLIHLGGR